MLYVGAHEYAGVGDGASLLVKKEEDQAPLSLDLMPKIYCPTLVSACLLLDWSQTATPLRMGLDW